MPKAAPAAANVGAGASGAAKCNGSWWREGKAMGDTWRNVPPYLIEQNVTWWGVGVGRLVRAVRWWSGGAVGWWGGGPVDRWGDRIARSYG